MGNKTFTQKSHFTILVNIFKGQQAVTGDPRDKHHKSFPFVKIHI